MVNYLQTRGFGGKYIKLKLQDDRRTQFDWYSCSEFHFHAPSEHTVDGKEYDLEMHIVCSMDSDNGSGRNKAVLAYFFKQSTDAYTQKIPILTKILSNWNASSQYYKINFKEDFYKTLKNSVQSNFYFYKGSNTKPPCTEDVNWYVSMQPIPILASQLKPFRDHYVNETFDSVPG